ncbi:BLUF domain-containing protein [Rhizobium sp. BK379]|jgi:hypothetical protein|uniref:BLUF domain-containing protein n=1 Tax=Rhizobium sp. BK379 TaxID=2587059 RepID=UPI000DD9D57B|nr:BLUF domain-containing protein [Rhizobium sp. BK379]MBB3444274.1 hypothetical protein [Rhizobium sp. BK379]
MSLYRLAYLSSNRLEREPALFRNEIDRILAASRRNNPAVDVTGALLFSSGFFGQVLEGPQTAVEATFERIQQDQRHGNVALLDCVPIIGRTFGDWSMAYVGSPSISFQSDLVLDPELLTGDALVSTLRSLVLDGVGA